MATAPVMNAGANSSIAHASIPTTAALTGSGTAYAPGTSIASYLWALLDKPAGSAAALSSTTAQNPTLNGVDTPGAYRLFLQGTDNLGTSSESNPMRAPSSAFRVIQVTTEHAALSKPAIGERNWHTKIHEVIDEVDGIRGELDVHVADLTDPHRTLSNTGIVNVTNDPTTAQILVATGTTEAEWQDPDFAYPLSAVDTAGVIECAETPIDSEHPKAVVKDKITFTAAIPGSLISDTFTPWQVAIHTSPSSNLRSASLVFYVPVDMKLQKFVVVFQNGGAGSPSPGSYGMVLKNFSAAELLTTDTGTLLGAATAATASSGESRVATTDLSATVNAGTYLAVICTAQPTVLGGGATVTVVGYEVF